MRIIDAVLEKLTLEEADTLTLRNELEQYFVNEAGACENPAGGEAAQVVGAVAYKAHEDEEIRDDRVLRDRRELSEAALQLRGADRRGKDTR